jgi:hypothetical protein
VSRAPRSLAFAAVAAAFALASPVARAQGAGPAQGGAPAQGAAPVARAPGAAPEGLQADVMIVFEASDVGARVEESWQLRNRGAAPVPASALALPLAAGARNAQLPPEAKGFHVGAGGARIEADEPLPPGAERTISVVYALETPGGVVRYTRTPHLQIANLRVIAEESATVRLEASLALDRRTRDLGGLKFSVWETKAVDRAKPLDLTFTGWPTRATWPRWASVGGAVAVIAWLILRLRAETVPGALGPRPAGATDATSDVAGALAPRLGALSPVARRERLVEALKLLEADVQAGRVERVAYVRRHRALVEELATTLRAVELEAEQLGAARAG